MVGKHSSIAGACLSGSDDVDLNHPNHKVSEMVPCKGTTNFGFVYSGGVVLGGDSRTSLDFKTFDKQLNIYVQYESIVEDDCTKIRYMRGNYRGRIYCTLCGLVEKWFGLYHYLNTKANVTSIEDAIHKASSYLSKYVARNTRRLEHMKFMGTPEAFGMLIGGYTVAEGHRLGVVTLDHKTVHWRLIDSAETLGSGAEFADDVLKISTNEEREAYGEGKIMTREQAFDLGSRTLSYAAARDPYSGGNFHRVHIQGFDVEHRHSNSLGSYVEHFGLIDSFGDIDRRSLFLLYVWPYPCWTVADMENLLGTIWPNGEVEWDDLQAYHFLARKQSDIHIHRLLFKDEQRAHKAYADVNQLADLGPTNNLEDKVALGFVLRSGTLQYPVYVGPSTIQFLTHMLNMPGTRSLHYPNVPPVPIGPIP